MDQGSDRARFSLLAGEAAVDDDDLYRLYAFPAAQGRCVVRANAIASLDGGATTGGTSGGLGGAGDRFLFAVHRELADVIVVGAGTARAENYGGARMSVAQRRRRQSRDQAEIPPIALVTRSGMVARDLPVLSESEAQPLVLTCASAAGDARRRVGSRAEVIDCSGGDRDRVDLGVALERLAARGMTRVLTEGGPSLLGAFIAAGLLDEMCLTTAPVLVGGAAVRVAGGGGDGLTALRRAHVLTDSDGYLYTRYVRG